MIPTENAEALQESRPALAQAWRSFLDYNPRNGVLAAATQLGEVLELWNLRDSTHVVLRGPGGEPEFRVSQGYGLPTGIMGFSDVQVGDSAVYAVFHGRAFRDIMQAAQQGETLPDGGKYLYVFSLRGEPLVRYELDHYVYGISVDERTGTRADRDVPRHGCQPGRTDMEIQFPRRRPVVRERIRFKRRHPARFICSSK